MKKLMLLCAGAIVLALLAGAVNVFAQNQATAPTYYEGERWEYDFKVDWKGLTEDSDRVQSGLYRVEFKGGKMETDQPFHHGGPTIYDPSLEHKWLEFPLKAGKKWKYRFRQKKRWRKPKVEITSVEKVTTPAGTFQAFKIEGKAQNRSYIYWYSQEAKSIVKYQFKRYHEGRDETSTITSELVTYKVQKK